MSKSSFDRWQSLTVGLYMSLVGYAVLAGIPVLSSSWNNLLNFTEVQVGRVAGADLGGLAFGAVIASTLITQVSRRVLVVASVLGAVATNFACIFYSDYSTTLILRFLAGMASGVFTGVAVATLGGRSSPTHAFNYLLFAFAFVQGAELYFLPKLSMDGIYLAFGLSYLPILLCLHWIPEPEGPGKGIDPSDSDVSPSESASRPALSLTLFLVAMGFTYVNIGAYWTYIELAASSASLDSEWVSSLLVWASLASLLGCLLATVISDRVGVARPLLVTLIIQGTSVSMLALGINELIFFASLFSFNFLWIFIDVYQMGSIARFDPTGRFAALMPAAQGLGQMIGPNIAATILALNGGYAGIFIICGCASVIACSLYQTAFKRLRDKR